MAAITTGGSVVDVYPLEAKLLALVNNRMLLRGDKIDANHENWSQHTTWQSHSRQNTIP